MRNKLGKGLILAGVLVLGYTFFHTKKNTNDIGSNAVMITNRAMNHGGTGLVYNSSTHKSWILTNDHVCKVVKDGGSVLAQKGNYQVHSIVESKQSDLCVVSVLDDLKVNTVLSSTAPKVYDDVLVSGFPALMPNVISKGHLSGRAVIPVFIGVKPCTEEDIQNNPLMCVFLGGTPIIKYYESVLTSATIMPGSSGSGVYNVNKELIGVVFAGQGDFGYSWTVPYEQVVNFLTSEAQTLTEDFVDQRLKIESKSETETAVTTRDLIEKCKKLNYNNDLTPENLKKLKEVCSLVSKDMIWRK